MGIHPSPNSGFELRLLALNRLPSPFPRRASPIQGHSCKVNTRAHPQPAVARVTNDVSPVQAPLSLRLIVPPSPRTAAHPEGRAGILGHPSPSPRPSNQFFQTLPTHQFQSPSLPYFPPPERPPYSPPDWSLPYPYSSPVLACLSVSTPRLAGRECPQFVVVVVLLEMYPSSSEPIGME